MPGGRWGGWAWGYAMMARWRRAASARDEPAHTAPEKVVMIATGGGSTPASAIPSWWISSLSCWKPRATSPLATRAPTGTPGGACTSRGFSSAARPQRSNRRSSAVPLGPVE